MKNIAQLFKALSDETRLRIIVLLTHGELCVCDIMASLELPQSTVSRHLAYLRNAGLVEDRREGVWMYYTLTDTKHTLQQDILTVLRRGLEENDWAVEDIARLERFLQTKRIDVCG